MIFRVRQADAQAGVAAGGQRERQRRSPFHATRAVQDQFPRARPGKAAVLRVEAEVSAEKSAVFRADNHFFDGGAVAGGGEAQEGAGVMQRQFVGIPLTVNDGAPAVKGPFREVLHTGECQEKAAALHGTDDPGIQQAVKRLPDDAVKSEGRPFPAVGKADGNGVLAAGAKHLVRRKKRFPAPFALFPEQRARIFLHSGEDDAPRFPGGGKHAARGRQDAGGEPFYCSPHHFRNAFLSQTATPVREAAGRKYSLSRSGTSSASPQPS